MGQAPEVNLAEERIEWPTGTRKEAVSPYLQLTKTVYDPVITLDAIPVGIVLHDADLTNIYCFVDGASSPSVTFVPYFGTNIAGTGEEIIGNSAGVVATTTLTTLTPHSGWIPKHNMIWMQVTATSGTLYSLTVIFRFRTRI